MQESQYFEQTGNEITTHYYLGGKQVALRRGDNLTYLMQDNLGSTAVTADSAGALAASTSYFSFGATRSSSGSLPTDRKFTGQRLDTTGLYYYGARYYDPLIGRFISADTIVPDPRNPQAFNRYSYCYNNPLKYIDETGNQPAWAAKLMAKVKNTRIYKWFANETQKGSLPGFYNLAGFERDSNGIYYAKQDSWQQYCGYNKVYDTGFDLFSDMNSTPYDFITNGQEMRIWLWKGDYLNLGTGAEMGLYYNGGPQWQAATQFALSMTLTLYDNNGNLIFSRNPSEPTWWNTGFNPNLQNTRADNLKAVGTIDCSQNEAIWNDLRGRYYQTPGWTFDDEKRIVTLMW